MTGPWDKRARTSKIQMIQVARRQLGMDEDTYRAAIALAVPGKSSCSDCTVLQLDRVIEHFKKVGFKPKKPASAKPVAESRTLDTSVEAKKARAIWLMLANIGVVTNASEAALAAYVKRQVGVEDLAWVKDMTPVIEGLKAWAARKLPAALKAKVEALKLAGVLLPDDSVAMVLARSAPTRRPDTFDALWAGWQRLETLELARGQG